MGTLRTKVRVAVLAAGAVWIFAIAIACSSTYDVPGGGATDAATDVIRTLSDGGEASAPAPCNASCDCAAGQACVLGSCAAPKEACERNIDCACDRYCTGYESGKGHCEPRCHANADCKEPSAFCYVPMGICGPCLNDGQCGAGNHCLAGVCTTGEAGAPNPPRCENSSQCSLKEPVCAVPPNQNAGSCVYCYEDTKQCGDGYFCHTNDCVPQVDAGLPQCDGGCSGGLTCDPASGNCVNTTCDPPCGSPARCDKANSKCICDNCGGACFQGLVCDVATCECVPDNHRDSPPSGADCTKGEEGCPCPLCQGCKSGLTCTCPIFGDTCAFISTCYATATVGICRR